MNRFSVLLAADFGVFLALRELLRALRARSGLSGGVFHLLETTFPQGFMGGWQFAVSLFLGLAMAGAYRGNGCWRDWGRIGRGVFIAAALVLWARIWEQDLLLVVFQGSLAVAVFSIMLALERASIGFVYARLPTLWPAKERVIIVGRRDDKASNRTERVLCDTKGIVCLGWVFPGGPSPSDEYLGTTDEIWEVLAQTDIDTIVLSGQLSVEALEAATEATVVGGYRCLAVPRYASGALRPRLVWVKQFPFTELTPPALNTTQLMAKRALDAVGALIGLVLLSPLFVFLAIIIKLDSKGPVFFSQVRVGFGGIAFKIHKFRTMGEDAHEQLEEIRARSIYSDNRLFKDPHDPRVTGVGRFLRRYSLDELPQLWNVLRGEMSLVGPRPPTMEEVESYEARHFKRFDVRPGMTGPWQVSGRNRIRDFETVVLLEREYIDTWSFWKDMKILLFTIPVVISGEGAH